MIHGNGMISHKSNKTFGVLSEYLMLMTKVIYLKSFDLPASVQGIYFSKNVLDVLKLVSIHEDVSSALSTRRSLIPHSNIICVLNNVSPVRCLPMCRDLLFRQEITILY